jgi:hypothetical protein
MLLLESNRRRIHPLTVTTFLVKGREKGDGLGVDLVPVVSRTPRRQVVDARASQRHLPMLLPCSAASHRTARRWQVAETIPHRAPRAAAVRRLEVCVARASVARLAKTAAERARSRDATWADSRPSVRGGGGAGRLGPSWWLPWPIFVLVVVLGHFADASCST